MRAKILISGAGMAGLTLAYWLRRYGFEPTVVERGASLPEGGYMIDFFGAGYDVAEKMGLRPQLESHDLRISEITFVDESDRRVGGVDSDLIRELLDQRACNILRSDLARTLYGAVEKDVEVVFGDWVTALAQDDAGVDVTFAHAPGRRFDFVVGADGLHSGVRGLVFGDEAGFRKYFGYYTASYTIVDGAVRSKALASYTTPGKQVGVYPIDDQRLATFFLFASPELLSYDRHDTAAQIRILRDVFRDQGWKCPELLAAIDRAPDFYLDSVSQIRMNHWSKGRITLVGDACCCPSLLSGQGAALAMAGAYVLAGALKRADGDPAAAFARYEAVMKPFIDEKQAIAEKFAGSFLPKSAFGLWGRNQFSRLMKLRFVSKLFLRKFVTDTLRLDEHAPDYTATAGAPSAV